MKTNTESLAWENLRYELHPWIKEAISSMGYPTMTPVQASTIPLLSGNKDVVVEAVTGSGKTLSYVIPVLQKVSDRLYKRDDDGDLPEKVKRGHMLSVVLAPTRELANQIQAVFDQVLQYLPGDYRTISTQLLVGSIGTVREDLDKFLKNQPQVLIGTPGRILDFLGSQYVKTNSLEIVILDEADKLLDCSFETDVVNILRKLPKQRRTGLFSATLSSAGDTIFRTGMNNPVKVQVKSKNSLGEQVNAPKSLQLSYMMIQPEFKITTLLDMLLKYQYKKAIVYFPTCTSVKHFYQIFTKTIPNDNDDDEPLKFFSLHGQLNTKARLRTLEKFTEGDANTHKCVLMATDVAARGIDIPDVDLVIQIDPPTDPDVFLHRCGRTGRANKVGRAIVMLNEESQEEDYVGFMQVKGITLHEMKRSQPDRDEHDSFQRRLRKYMLEDRARHELAVKSYVGFIRYYSKHVASSIFRMASLDYLAIAKMYGLLRLPKMPETRYISKESMPENGWLGDVIDMDNYAYADKQQEKSRLDNLEQDKAKKIEDAKRRKELQVKNDAWSSKVERKENKQERKEKMKRKREAIEKQILEGDTSDEEETAEDWKDMVRKNKKQKSSGIVQGSFDDL
ncbi:ATP-dependent rRNA helicase SPB42 [Candida viswanathii]|uniref:ATP-dependent RNA helicase n=1 Tax=Candida viswanathii TaxID=5486 RepID=A0A367XZ22_9ASCO|nr:ATP-dependent rRNA helicase SPB42 [Candida viswanathii]